MPTFLGLQVKFYPFINEGMGKVLAMLSVCVWGGGGSLNKCHLSFSHIVEVSAESFHVVKGGGLSKVV